MTGLLDLPNELLRKIISYDPVYSSDTTLLALSCLHPRLNAICLPLYRGFTCSASHTVLEVSCGGDDRYNPLRALTVAHHISHIEDFDCRLFLVRNNDSSRRALLENFQRITRSLDRLDHVGEVKLSVRSKSPFIVIEDADSADVVGLKEWAKAYGGLLNKILEKSCHTLTLSHLRLDLHSRGFRLPLDLLKAAQSSKTGNGGLSRFKSIFSSESADAGLVDPMTGLHGQRAKSGGPSQGEHSKDDQSDIFASFTPSPSTLSKTRLHSLHINSELFLLPPCLNWTLSILQSSSSRHLTSLSLSQLSLSDIGDPLAGATLPFVWSSVPSLKRLTIKRCTGLSPDLIARFLDACKELEEVVLCGNEDQKPWHPPAPIPTLPKLHRLLAPSRWILYLLQLSPDGPLHSGSWLASKFKPNNPVPLPSLRNLVLLAPEGPRHEVDIDQILRALARIYVAQRHPRPRPALESFAMYVELGVGSSWAMMSQLDVMHRRYSMLGWAYRLTREAKLPSQLIDIPQPLAALDKLWINLTGPIGRLDHRRTIAEWLGMFTRLKAVKVTSDDEVNRLGECVWDVRSEHEVGKQIELLVELLKEAHPRRSVRAAYWSSNLEYLGTFPEIQLR